VSSEELGGGIAGTVTPAGKKKRLSSEESRERLIQAGIDALAREGLSVGMDSVNLEQAVRDSTVPRSSAYAVWSTDEEFSPQELFQREVLLRAVDRRKETTERLMEEIAEHLADEDESLSREEKRRELVRIAATSSLRNVQESASWQIVFALRSILQTAPTESRDQDLLDWISRNEEEARIETIEQLYKPLAEMFGLRPRPEFGERAWHLAEISSASLVEGMAMRSALSASQHFYGHPNPASSEDNEWSLYALLFERMIDVFLEPIPET